ncbi:hypothetical protein Cgig2_009273 [Carnegiea gigantea]|uniref:Uncharacterized protein n=1 Tax=Carnegiea gigantea TaxID=171969 RepID=A0A9Q1K0M7_9CARY|nr:hypothetical protein Cgig2_009273 [Carnegiea gigantea]
MEDIGSLWGFQESVDELKQKIQYMTYELELTKKEANEEMKKNNEQMNKLLHLLQTAIKERDEAKSQLNKLQQSLSFNQPIINFDQLIPTPFSPDTPLFPNYQSKSNSGISDNSNTNTNRQSRVSSPVVDSLSYPQHQPSSPDSPVVDQGSLIIEKLAKGRPLPPKGSLMQAVKDAGPPLATLLVAGSLPRWRNPPGRLTHPIPPVKINGYLGSSSSVHSQSCDWSVGHFAPSNMLDFGGGNGSSGNCLMGSAVNFNCQVSKRQRLV